MIYVDPLFGCRTPWGGRQSCHLISDASVGELLDFANSIELPITWFQARSSIPHFDLSPRLRARAIAAGAVEIDQRGFVAAVRRWRATHAPEAAGGSRG